MSSLYRMAAWVIINVRANVSLPSGLSWSKSMRAG
jgi:hypothetical protein